MSDPLARAAWLAAAYPGRTIDEAHIASWAEEMTGLTEHELDDVIAMLRLRSIDPPSVAQVRDCIKEVRQETMSPHVGHVYLDETECPVCQVIHGQDLETGQSLHGASHLADGDFERAAHPDRCGCGFNVPPNVNVERVIELVSKGLVVSMRKAFDR